MFNYFLCSTNKHYLLHHTQTIFGILVIIIPTGTLCISVPPIAILRKSFLDTAPINTPLFSINNVPTSFKKNVQLHHIP